MTDTSRQPESTLSGKIALVTGSTSGIGRSIALRLARAGADIVVHGRAESSRSLEVIEDIQSMGRKAWPCYCDFADRKQLDGFVAAVWKLGNGIDILVNNAGGDVLTGDWTERTFSERLDYVWEVDVRATLLLSRTFGEMMSRRSSSEAVHSGVILNMGWDQAWQGMEGDSGEMFATTKGAIMSMSKSLAQTLAPHVRVNCLAPGWIRTEWAGQASESWQQRAKKQSLMNRWGQPEDVAELAHFLCQDSASFINGQVLPVNGGFNYFSS